MPKPIVKYRVLHSCAVGDTALVHTINHPGTSNSQRSRTSMVVSYDPKTGCFETSNTRYIPGPFATWPGGEDCPVLQAVPRLKAGISEWNVLSPASSVPLTVPLALEPTTDQPQFDDAGFSSSVPD